jgi:hypothetical protein
MTEGVFFVIDPDANLVVDSKPASRDRKEDHKDRDGRSYEPGFVTFEPNLAKD